MSADAERRWLGADGPADDAAPSLVPCAWPMTPEQQAFTSSVVESGAWRALAWWLRERDSAGRGRFSQRDVPLDALGASAQRLVDLGLLRRHVYPSGAWQFATIPFTRSWFMAVITTPVATAAASKEPACP